MYELSVVFSLKNAFSPRKSKQHSIAGSLHAAQHHGCLQSSVPTSWVLWVFQTCCFLSQKWAVGLRMWPLGGTASTLVSWEKSQLLSHSSLFKHLLCFLLHIFKGQMLPNGVGWLGAATNG